MRAEQRIEALASVVRSLVTVVIYTEQLGANGISIRFVVKTRPSEQFRVSRELRRRIKAAFDREGIAIPFPQQTVWPPCGA